MAKLNRRKRRQIEFPGSIHNNRKSTKSRRIQVIYSEKQYIFKERYITNHMLEKAIRMGLSKNEAIEQYGKNRYTYNNNAKPIKVIIHSKD